jgi:hypothetical protein
MARLTSQKTKKVFRPDDEDGAWVEIKYLKKGVRNRISALSNDVTATGDSGEMATTIALNQTKKRRLFYENIIVKWGNFFDRKGNQVKPTLKNIMSFDEELGDLYEWLQEESEAYIIEVEDGAEEEQGN